MQSGIFKEAMTARSIQQSEETKKLFASLLTTGKNLSLYPEGHSICTDSIIQLHAKLETFIQRNGDLTLEIEKDRVICQDIEVSTGLPEEGTLPHILFRDGIGWMQFTEGIELEEIRQVFSIIRKYSVLLAEPEGDIVTDFWEAHFKHVQYKADDFFSETAPEQSDSLSKPATVSLTSETETAPEKKEEPLLSGEAEISPDIDLADFELSPREEAILQEMIVKEETASSMEHLNMLLDMLMQYEEKKDFDVVLEVLAEEFKGSFVRHDFESVFIILAGIHGVLGSGRLSVPWADERLRSFYHEISSDTEGLKQLKDIWSILDIQQVETLKHIFQYLNPSVVNFLANLLPLKQPEPFERILEDSIYYLVHEDKDCLESLMNDSDEKIVVKLLPVLSRLEKDVFLKYLMQLTRHSSTLVRRKAVRAILDTESNQLSSMFNLMEDPDTSIRRMVLAQMGKSRSESAENFLLQYLQNNKFSDAQSEQVVEYFNALGKCGSAKSIPFLSKTLMNLEWRSGSKTSAYREGAALALAALNIPEARQIIEKAGRSLRPGLRRIARKAEDGLIQKNKGGR